MRKESTKEIDSYIKELVNSGLDSHHKGDNLRAIWYYKNAIAHNPKLALPYIHLGRIMLILEDNRQAMDAFNKALAISPKNIEVLYYMSLCLRRMGKVDDAIRVCKHGLSIEYNIKLVNSLAQSYQIQGKYDQAITLFYEVLNNDSQSNVHINLAYCRFANGDFSLQAWELYEQRWLLKEAGKKRHPRIKTFTKDLLYCRNAEKKLKDKKILIWAEQGFGDAILFSRFLSKLKASLPNTQIIFECHDPLKDLMQSLAGVDQVIGRSDLLPDGIDYQLPLMSLGFILELTQKDFSHLPYLRVQDSPILPKAFLQETPRKKIGLIWNVSNTAMVNKFRNIPFVDFTPILQVTNCDFYSLQKGPARSDLVMPTFRHEVIDLGSWLYDFNCSAAFMKHMDLIITVDTAAAHLAGSLGINSWVLLPYDVDWRWGRVGNDTIWYDSLHLYRQNTLNDWSGVLQQVKKDLLEEN